MPLKFQVAKLEEVDAKYRDLYAAAGDQFQLQVEGVKTQGDVDAVQTALTKERADHKITKTALTTIKDKYAPLGDKDPNEIASALDKIPALESAAAGKGFDQTKVDALVQAGVDRVLTQKTAPLTRENEALKTQIAEQGKQVETLTTAQRNRTIDDANRAAATALKVSESAMPDVIELLRGKFTVAEDGKVITEAGLSPEAVITDAKKTKPHWWAAAQGAGAQGGKGGTGVADADNPYTAAGWNITKQGTLYQSDPAKAKQFADAAGVAVTGAIRPKAAA